MPVRWSAAPDWRYRRECSWGTAKQLDADHRRTIQERKPPAVGRRRAMCLRGLVAIDPETKLVPSYLVGKRTRDNAVDFMFDLSNRLTNRVQISSDSLR